MSVPSQDQVESSVACFAVRAAADAGMLSRVVELFAKRGLIPSCVHSRLSGQGDAASIMIDIQIESLDPALAEQIAETLRQIVMVERVLTARKRRARAA